MEDELEQITKKSGRKNVRVHVRVIYRRPNLLFIIMNDPLVNIDIDVNLFNNIYPDLNVNQSSEYTMIARSSIN